MEPILIDVPTRIDTERFVLRCPLPGDGARVNPAVVETLTELRAWMPWAQLDPSIDESETVALRSQASFITRTDLVFYAFERAADGGEGGFVAGSGLHRLDWEVRRFEIGFWRRKAWSQRGVVDEIVRALSRLAFDKLAARRVEIRMDDRNRSSWRVAERCGFTLEGVLRCDSLTPDGMVRDTRVYSRVRGVEEQ